MRISPGIDPTSVQVEASGQELPKTGQRNSKTATPFRQVMTDTSVEERGQRAKSCSRSKHREPVSQNESAIDYLAAQRLVAAILTGGRELQASRSASDRRGTAAAHFESISSSQSKQPSDSDEFGRTAGKRMSRLEAVKHVLHEADRDQSTIVNAAGSKASSLLLEGRRNLPENAIKTTEISALLQPSATAPSVRETGRDANPALTEGERIRRPADEKLKTGAAAFASSIERPDLSVNESVSRFEVSNSPALRRDVNSGIVASTADGDAEGDAEASQQLVGGQIESQSTGEVEQATLANFSAALGLTPAKQISDFISKTIQTPAQRTSHALEPDGPGRNKALSLELHPENIGRVRLTMHLRGDELDIHIVAKSKFAVEAIEHDRDLLGQLLSEAGFRVSPQGIRIEAQAAPSNDFRPDVQDIEGRVAQGSGDTNRDSAEKHEPSWQQTLKAGKAGIETSASADADGSRRNGVYL